MPLSTARLRAVTLAVVMFGTGATMLAACNAPSAATPATGHVAAIPPSNNNPPLPANLSPDCHTLLNLLNQTAELINLQSQDRFHQFVAEARAAAGGATDPTVRNALNQLADLYTQIAAFRAQPTTLPSPAVTYDRALIDKVGGVTNACLKAAQSAPTGTTTPIQTTPTP